MFCFLYMSSHLKVEKVGKRTTTRMGDDGNYASITSELNDLERLLKSVKREAKIFLEQNGIGSSDAKRRKVLHSSPPKSAWARSKVPQVASVVPRTVSAKDTESRAVLDAEKLLHTRAPTFTMGSRPSSLKSQSRRDEIIAAEPNPLTYRVKDDLVSTKHSKNRGMTFGTASRDSKIVNNKDEMHHSNSPISADSELYEIVEYEEVIPTGCSFGKAERFPTSSGRNEKTSVELNVGNAIDNADLLRADKSVRPHTPTVRYYQQQEKVERKVEVSNSVIPSSSVNWEAISYRPRTATTTIRPDSSIPENVKIAKANNSGERPGPGYYDVSNSALALTGKESGSTTGHKIRSSSRSDSRILKKKELETAELGPGSYNPERPRRIVGLKYCATAQSKDENKHLQLKRYYEQKAQDAREYHDHQNYSDDSAIRARTPTVSFGRAFVEDRNTRLKRSASLSSDDKSERVRVARLNQQGSVATSSQLSYNIKYDVVERKSGTAVAWGAEIQARQSTREKLSQKSQVQTVLADKEMGDPASKRFYGPSLPVAWVTDKPSLAKKLLSKDKQGDSDDENGRANSPTAEVLRLLASRNGDKTFNGSDPADQDPYTQAFLRSSYAGSLHRKAAGVHMEPIVDDETVAARKLLAIEEKDFDYLGPQIQPDWTANKSEVLSKRSKAVSVRLDKVTGREKVKVHAKGQVETEDFGSHQIRKDEEKVGPGEYDVLSQIEISKAKAKGGTVQFDKIIAREDIIGPRGEKPISSQLAEIELQADDELGMEKLDIDYATAKDAARKKNKNIILYAKDRYPEEKKKPEDLARLDHLGGSWFEGMYETMQKSKAKVVDFERMKSRSMMDAAEEQDLDDELHDDLGVTREGEALDLRVEDYHPHKVDPNKKVLEFADAKKHPRFQIDRATKELQSRNANQPELSICDELLHERRGVTFVDMDKMSGRQHALDALDENNTVDAMVHGHIDDDAAILLGEENAKAIATGQNTLKKRSKSGIDMSKQRGRYEMNAATEVDIHEQRIRENEEVIAVEENASNRGKYFSEADELDISSHNDGQKGLVPWEKMSSRGNTQAHEHEVVQTAAEVGQGNIELDLTPTAEGTTKHRRIKGGLNWRQQRDDNLTSEVEIANKVVKDKIVLDSILDPMEVVGQPNGTALELIDVDPGDFKGKGFTSLLNRISRGQEQGVRKMNNLIGRNDNAEGQATLREAVAKEFGQEILRGPAAGAVAGDVVQIDPSDEGTLPKGKQNTAMRSNSARFPDSVSNNNPVARGKERNKNLLGDEAEEYDTAPRVAGRASTEQLKLEVKDEAVRTSRVKAFPTMSSGSERLQARPVVSTQALQQLNLPPTTVADPANASPNNLQLEVKDTLLRRETGASNSGATSLRNSAARFPIAAGGQDESKLMKETIGETEELKLEPKDELTRNRIANNGAVLSKAATGRGSSSAIKPDIVSGKAASRKSSTSSLSSSSKAKSSETARNVKGSMVATSSIGKQSAPSSKLPSKDRNSKSIGQAPLTVSPPAISAPTPARPPSKEYFSLEEEMKKLGL